MKLSVIFATIILILTASPLASASAMSWGADEELHQGLIGSGVLGSFLNQSEEFLKAQGYVFRFSTVKKEQTAKPHYKNLTVQITYEIPVNMDPCIPGPPCEPLQTFVIELHGSLIEVQGNEMVRTIYSVNSSAYLTNRHP